MLSIHRDGCNTDTLPFLPSVAGGFLANSGQICVGKRLSQGVVVNYFAMAFQLLIAMQ